MNSDPEAAATECYPDEDRRTRSAVYKLLGALLAGPPDAALVELLRGLDVAATPTDTLMHPVWRDLRQTRKEASSVLFKLKPVACQMKKWQVLMI